MSSVEPECLAREQGGQVLEQRLVLGGLGRFTVDVVDLEQSEVALAFLGRTDAPGDVVAGAQVEAAGLRGRDVHIVRAGQIGLVRCAQEAKAILQDFQHALAVNAAAGAGVRLEDVENDILLACAGDAFLDAERFRQGYQFVGVLALEFVEVDQRAVVLARIVFLVVAWQSTVGVILLAVATTTIAIAVAIPIAPVALTLALTLTLALALLRVALLRVALTLLRIGVLAIACRLRALRSAGFAAGIRVAGKVRFGCVPVARVVLGGGCRELRV